MDNFKRAAKVPVPNLFRLPRRDVVVGNPYGLYCLTPLFIVVSTVFAMNLLILDWNLISTETYIEGVSGGCASLGELRVKGEHAPLHVAAVGEETQMANPSLPAVVGKDGLELMICRSPGSYLEFTPQPFQLSGAVSVDSFAGIWSAVQHNGFGYFGSDKLIKVHLETMEVNATSSEFPLLASAVMYQGHGYFGTISDPGQVVKFDLDTLEETVLTFNPGEEDVRSVLVLDGVGYFGVDTEPGMIIKVQLDSMRRLDSLTLLPGEDSLRGAVLHDGYGYWGTFTTPGRVVKVNLRTFQREGALHLKSGDDYVYAAVEHDGFGYFGTYTAPGRVVKVNLDTMSVSAVLRLEPGEDTCLSAVSHRGYGYFGTMAGVVQVELSTLFRVTSSKKSSWQGPVQASILVGNDGFFGTRAVRAATSLTLFRGSPRYTTLQEHDLQVKTQLWATVTLGIPPGVVEHYEVQLRRDANALIGWATHSFESVDGFTFDVVGEDEHTWAVDLRRGVFFARGHITPISIPGAWSDTVIIGCTLNAVARTMRFTIDHVEFHVAALSTNQVFPAVSGEDCEWKFQNVGWGRPMRQMSEIVRMELSAPGPYPLANTRVEGGQIPVNRATPHSLLWLSRQFSDGTVLVEMNETAPDVPGTEVPCHSIWSTSGAGYCFRYNLARIKITTSDYHRYTFMGALGQIGGFTSAVYSVLRFINKRLQRLHDKRTGGSSIELSNVA